MFATLLGALPRPTVDAAGEPIAPRIDDPDADVTNDLVTAAIRAQEAAGLEPITDGRLRDPSFERLAATLSRRDGIDDAIGSVIDGWRATAAATTRAAKQALPGPYSVGLRMGGSAGEREAATLAAAEALGTIVAALADAGCPLVEIEEPAPGGLVDDVERSLFGEAHRRLTGGTAPAIHRSLSFVGGSVPQAAIDAVLEAPYASLAVDLIAGPDNWYLVRKAPRERGIVAGVMSAGEVDEVKEVMHWGAHYAASSAGRGRDRVGLGSAGSWANLTWEAALRKLSRLGEAARIAAMPRGEELARSLDPRAVSSRRAALGHEAGARPRRGRRCAG